MNINTIQSYAIHSFSGEFHFQEIRKNETPDELCAMPSGITLGSTTIISNLCILDLVKNDRVDLFIKQTSEAAGSDITINKGRYTILKI